MKPLFTCLLLAAGISAGAQTYMPFPTANATWTQRIGHGEAEPSFNVMGMKAADTVLAGQTYHKVYTSTDPTLDEADFTGGLREDAKRIYYYDAAAHVERLIYDFTVGVGDTIKVPGGSGAAGIVDHIDSVMISGIYHKRFNFRQLTSSSVWVGGTWIEGIGNSGLGGLLGSPMAQPTCDCAVNTICASEYSYHNSQYSAVDCDAVLLHAAICVMAGDNVKVFPNPLVNGSVLQLSGNVKNSTVSIYDMRGGCVKTMTADGKDTIGLDRADYVPGVYVYRVVSDVNVMSGRFVVE